MNEVIKRKKENLVQSSTGSAVKKNRPYDIFLHSKYFYVVKQ